MIRLAQTCTPRYGTVTIGYPRRQTLQQQKRNQGRERRGKRVERRKRKSDSRCRRRFLFHVSLLVPFYCSILGCQPHILHGHLPPTPPGTHAHVTPLASRTLQARTPITTPDVTDRRNVRHNTPRHITPHHKTVQHTTPRHITPHHKTVQHTTPHRTTPHYTTPQDCT